MAHFAEIDQNNKVKRVIVADQSFINSGVLGGAWVQTSFNASGGLYLKGATKTEQDVNKLLGTTADITARNRKNFAAAGYTYDPIDNSFIPPSPYPSWVLDKISATWQPPKPYPKDGQIYRWSEPTINWILE